MGLWDTIIATINKYRTPVRISTPTSTSNNIVQTPPSLRVSNVHSTTQASANITARPVTKYSYGRDRPTSIKKKRQTIEVPTSDRNNIVQTPPSLRASNVHSSVPASPLITARPESIKRVEPTVFRDPRTFTELKQVLGAMEQKVSSRIPDVATIQAAQVRHVEQYPKTAAAVHKTFGQLPEPIYDFSQEAGKSTYGYVQENPLKTAGWVGVSLFGGQVIGGAAKVITPLAKILPYGSQTVRAVDLFAKTKYLSKVPEVAMTGAFGYVEYKTISQPVLDITKEGMVYERKPTYAEMGARSGEGIAISGALLSGVGIAKYGSKVKGLFTKAPKTAEDVALAAEEVKYTVLKGFKTTEKQQLQSGIVDYSTTKTRLITEDVPASLIDAGEVARWKKSVQYEDVRPMFSSYTQSVTNPLGETLSLQKTGKIDLIRGAPEPDDIISGIQQMTLGDMSLSKVGTGKTAVEYGGLSKDVFKRGSRDWAIDFKLDAAADMGKVKGIEQFKTVDIGGIGFDVRGGTAQPIFEIPTTIKHTRGKITGAIGEPVPTVTPTAPKHLTLDEKQWGTKHVGLDQPKLDEFWSEGGIKLKKKSVDAIEGFKIDIPKQTKKLTGKPMKPLYTKKDDSIITRMSDDIKGGTSGQIQIFDAVEDVKAVPKTKGIVAEQILDIIEPKQTGIQAGAMFPKIKSKQTSRIGSAFGAPSVLGLSRDLSFGQAIDIAPTVKQTQKVSIAPIFDVAPVQSLKPESQLKPTEKMAPFAIMGTKFKPVTAFAPVQKPRTRFTPITAFKPFQAIKPILDIGAIGKVKPVVTPKPVYRGVFDAPVVPKKPILLFGFPKTEKKKKGKKKRKESETEFWTFTNPIKSAKDML